MKQDGVAFSASPVVGLRSFDQPALVELHVDKIGRLTATRMDQALTIDAWWITPDHGLVLEAGVLAFYLSIPAMFEFRSNHGAADVTSVIRGAVES